MDKISISRISVQDGRAYVDQDGSLWMELDTPAGPRKVGISSQSIFAPGFDRELATRL